VLRVNLRPATPDDDQARGAEPDRWRGRAVAAEHDVQIDVHGGFGRPPKPMTPEAEACSSWSSRPAPTLASDRLAADRRGVRRQQYRRLRRAGGRHDGRARRQDSQMEEYLIVDSLAERAALSALTILRLAGGRMSFASAPRGDDFRAIYEWPS
jgi:glutamate carboxypeptidase